jgi:hypothetical protein
MRQRADSAFYGEARCRADRAWRPHPEKISAKRAASLSSSYLSYSN